jgi:hypothetical protein
MRLEGTTMTRRPNNLPETNRRPVSAPDAGRQFRRAVHAQASVFGGGRSAKRSAESRAIEKVPAPDLILLVGNPRNRASPVEGKNCKREFHASSVSLTHLQPAGFVKVHE